MAAQVGGQRAIRCAERPDHRLPARPRLGEAVEQDDVLGHAPTMTATDAYLGLRAFADELARCGLRQACTSPGSRSTPLVLSLAREPRHPHDLAHRRALRRVLRARPGEGERAAGGARLHLGHGRRQLRARGDRGPRGARAAARPHRRPPAGAARGRRRARRSTRSSSTAARPSGSSRSTTSRPRRSGMRWLRQLACRAFWTALDGRPGPVHLNFPLREPLVLDEPLPEEEPGGGGREGGRPWVTRPRTLLAPGADAPRRPAGPARSPPARGDRRRARRARPRPRRGARRARRPLALPLLADPLSGARRGPAAVAHYDALLRDAGFAAAHAPDLVLRFGDLPTSKPLRQWLARPRRACRSPSTPRPPGRTRPGASARSSPPTRGSWRRSWPGGSAAPSASATGSTAGGAPTAPRRGAIAQTLDGLSEPRVAAELGVRLPAAAPRSWSPPRCRCATSRRSSRRATTRRACSPTAAPTGSTARSRPPSASAAAGATGRSCC